MADLRHRRITLTLTEEEAWFSGGDVVIGRIGILAVVAVASPSPTCANLNTKKNKDVLL